MNFRAVLSLALMHALVDAVAQVVTPLWPQLKQDLGLAPWAFTLVFALWQSATSVSQPLFGYWGDRVACRWLVGAGPAVAVVCIALIGCSNNVVLLTLLLVGGGLGIGAFHPEAAVGVVEAAGARPASALSLFAFGGMVGLGVGPILSGALAGNYGRQGLVWIMPAGLLLLGLFLAARVGRPVDSADAPHAGTPDAGATLSEVLTGRWLSAGLLLGVSTLRNVPALGIPLALAFWLNRQGFSETHIGTVQGVFLLSGGVGTLLCPLLLRPGREVFGLVATILPAGALMLLLTASSPVARYAGLAGSGLLLQGAIPILIAYSQRLLPRGRRLAASLILGTSWGIGGLIVAALEAFFAARGRYEEMLSALVPFTVAAAVGSWLLPREDRLAKGQAALVGERRLQPGTTIVQV